MGSNQPGIASPPLAHGPAASTAAPADPAAEPAGAPAWSLPDARWEALEPRGLYARRLRTPFLAACALSLAVLSLPVALAIAAVNAVQFRSLRRVLYSQERVGRRGRVFRVHKFRTMRGRRPTGDDGRADRERVTRFGRFLRNTHLDELPQLLNVLRGEMSLVGPRPEMVEIERWAAGVAPTFRERLVLRPGITGRAQVTQGYTGLDARAYREKAAANRAYVETLSFAGDVAILFETARWMLRGRGWSWRPAPPREPGSAREA